MISGAHLSHRCQETVGKLRPSERSRHVCCGAWVPIKRLIGSYLHHFLGNRFQMRAPERRNSERKPRGWGTFAQGFWSSCEKVGGVLQRHNPTCPPGPAATMSCPRFPHGERTVYVSSVCLFVFHPFVFCSCLYFILLCISSFSKPLLLLCNKYVWNGPNYI